MWTGSGSLPPPVLCLIPPFHSWGLEGQRTRGPQRPRVTSVLSPQAPLMGLAGRPPHAPSKQPESSTAAPSTPAGTALGHRALRQRESSFCASWPLASFSVLIVSGFVLRNKKHVHLIVNFMIKPVSLAFLCDTRRLASPYPCQSPPSSQVARDRPSRGVVCRGWGGRKNGEEKRGARAISCDSQGRAWVNASPPPPPPQGRSAGEQVYTGQQVLGSVGAAEGSYP